MRLLRLTSAGLAGALLLLAACDRLTERNETLEEAAYGDPPSTTTTTEAPHGPTTTAKDWWTPEDLAAYEERVAQGPDSGLGIISGRPVPTGGDLCPDGTFPRVTCEEDWPCELIVSKLETGECWWE